MALPFLIDKCYSPTHRCCIIVKQLPPQKVFGPSKPTPNTFLEGTWSPRDYTFLVFARRRSNLCGCRKAWQRLDTTRVTQKGLGGPKRSNGDVPPVATAADVCRAGRISEAPKDSTSGGVSQLACRQSDSRKFSKYQKQYVYCVYIYIYTHTLVNLNDLGRP